jgi:NADPH:quinone reductase
MAETMMAGVSSEEGLVIAQVPKPAAGPGQILVAVEAAGLNRADLNAAKGAGVATKGSLGKPIGMEWAGRIVACGEGVQGHAVGDHVACSGAGGYAQFAVAESVRAIGFDPGRVPVEDAAVLPLALMTAHNALVGAGNLKPGDNVIVSGASSAVGLAAVRIAKLLGAAFVAATSTNADKRARLGKWGADLVLDPTMDSWVEAYVSATDGHGADVTVDMVTGPSLDLLMRAAATCGRIVNVGRLGGLRADIDLDYHALKRLSLIGVTFRTRSLAEICAIVEGVRADLWRHVESGALRLPIDRTFALEEAPAAHAYMSGNRHFGKIILRP